MTIASPKRIGALALVAAFAVAACGGGATSPGTQVPATAAGRRHRLDRRLRQLDRRADLDRRRRALQAAEPRLQLPDRGPRHRRRLRPLLQRRDRHLRRLPRHQGRRGGEVQAEAGIEYVELKVAYDGLSVMTNVEQHRDRLPQLRRHLRPRRPGVDRLHEVVRRRGDRQGARLQHRPARRRPRDHRPRRGVRHVRLLRRARPGQDRRGARPGRPDPARLHELGQRQRHHRGHHAATRRRSAGSASPSPRRTPTRSSEIAVSKDPNGTCVEPERRDGLRRQLPDLAAALHLRQQGQGRGQSGRRRLRRLLPRRGTIAKVLETVPYVNLPAEELAATRAAWEAR